MRMQGISRRNIVKVERFGGYRERLEYKTGCDFVGWIRKYR
jgi:hypothetical protein